MSDLAPVLFAVCGLSIICVGLVVIGGFLLARVAGISVLAPILETFLNRETDGGEAGSQGSPAPRPASRAPRDLRGRARSLDFDEAVAKYQQQGGQASSQSADRPPRPSRRLSRREVDDEEDPSARSLRKRRSREDDYVIYDDDDEGDIFL